YVFVYLPERHSAAPAAAAVVLSAPAVSTNLYASSAPEVRTDLDFVGISEKVGPAVVKIVSEHKEKAREQQGLEDQFPFDDFWDRFFGRPAPRQPQEYRSMVQGTGFFITADGYILTNNHIAEDSTKNTITTLQGNDYEAKVVGTDPKTDLALLKIEAKDLPFATLGDSALVKVGEWVLAIGNPLGMEHTVTAGIVSAKGRQLGVGMNVPTYQDFIQTDAAINRGNSGGPLVNMRGEVIGINSNILSPTGGNIGIGFAIPSNMARKIIAQLKDKGKVTRGRLGVVMQDVTDGMRKQFGIKAAKGAIVTTIEPDGPAEKAGFKQYDVIVEINGQPIEDSNDLKFKIADMEPGKKITVKVIRDGKEITLMPTIEEMEPEVEKGQATSADKDVGLSLAPMTPSLARRYGYRTTEGLLVTEVRNYSEADKAGLATGDIILEANRQKVATVREFEGILKKTASGEEVILLVRRESDGQSQDMIIPLKVS
ncbi:MAG TPA: DegQ family serine endoprotease, partial [Acidobacteriota bacterium]|nr:DegQ family serine endoprotease [Acidobacteriota bacterium]